MDVQHVRPVRQDRVDVDVFDVWLVGHRVFREEEFTDMLQINNIENPGARRKGLYWTYSDVTVIRSDTDVFLVDIIEIILDVSFEEF